MNAHPFVLDNEQYNEIIHNAKDIEGASEQIIELIVGENKELFLDSSVFQSLLVKDNPYQNALARKLFNAIENGKAVGIASVFSLYDAIRLGKSKEAQERIELLLTKFPNLTFLAAGFEILKIAADLQAEAHENGMELTIDSMIYATALNYAEQESVQYVTMENIPYSSVLPTISLKSN